MAGEDLSLEKRREIEERLGEPIGPMSEEELEEKEMDWINAEIAVVRAERRAEREARIAQIGLEAVEAEEREKSERWYAEQVQRRQERLGK